MTRAVAIAAALLVPCVALSANTVLSMQGRLLDSEDRPVNGSAELEFALFPVAAGGTAVWNETYEVHLRDGVYAFLAGETEGGKKALPAELFIENPTLWLQTSVNGTPTVPRLRLAEVPLAGRAGWAATAARADSAAHADVADSAITADTASHATEADRATEADTAKALSCEGCLTPGHVAEGFFDGLDAATVGGAAASATPAPGGLLVLDGDGRIPLAALPGGGGTGGIDAYTLRGHAPAATRTPDALPVLDSNGRLHAGMLPTTINATSLGGVAAADYVKVSDLPALLTPKSGTATLFDPTGSGRLDGALLPQGLFRNRTINGRNVYSPDPSRFVARELTFLKRASNTWLEITTSHSGGPNMDGTHTIAARHEVLLDEALVGYGTEYQNNGGTGWRLWPRTYREYVPSIPAGIRNVSLEYRQQGATEYHHKWSGVDLFEVREVPLDEPRSIVRFTTDIQTTNATNFTPVEHRAITYTKKGGTSVPLLVTIQDAWGSHASNANGGWGCQWMLYVNGSPANGGRAATIHHDKGAGYVMYPGTFGWIVTGLNATAHAIDLRVRGNASVSSLCRNGYGSRGFISVVELDPDRVTFATNLGQEDEKVQHNPIAPTLVPGREVTYEKKESGTNTDLRITWMDTSGYNKPTSVSQRDACLWRLFRNGSDQGYAREHTSALTGERYKPGMAEWVLRGVGAGEQKFELRVEKRHGDISHCRTGHFQTGTGVSGASSFLLVQETPRND